MEGTLDDRHTTVRLAPGASYELPAYAWNTPGRHDYKSEGFDVRFVERANGIRYTPEWGDELREVFPGCVALRREGRRYLRLSAEACPVRVLFVHWFSYTGSHPDHGSSWSRRTWYRFEAEEEGP